jgi:hypothetical protein
MPSGLDRVGGQRTRHGEIPQPAIEEAHKQGRRRKSMAGNPGINQKVSRTKQ